MTNKSQTKLFEDLYTQYRPMVQQMCLGYLKGDTDQAKDLTQEIFINAWNALEKFRGEAGYKTWIYRITVNTCLKYIRDKKDVEVRTKTEEITEEQSDHQPNNNYDALYHAIGKLEKLDRLIIMMVLDELDYGEISEIVGISSVNLRVKIHRIKKNLKKLLENDK